MSAPDAAARLPIKARLTAMSERTRALLEYHFDHDGRRVFTIASSVDTPDVVIVDYDYPGARDGIVDGRWQAVTPLMVLAHGEPELERPVTVVSKPLDRARLDAAALQLLVSAGMAPAPDGIAASEAGPASVATPPPGASAAPSAPAAERDERRRRRFDDDGSITLDDTAGSAIMADAAASAASEADRARQEARLEMLCGPPRTLDDLLPSDDPVHRYHPRRHVGAHLSRALDGLGAGSVAVSLSVGEIELHALSWMQRVFSTVSLERAVNVERLFAPFGDAEVTVTSYRPEQARALVDRLNRDARHAFSFEAFAWLAALFAARGRLPVGFDPERPCRLRHWPNLTRLERIPHDVHIAAAWTRRPISLATVTRLLGCEPRFVAAFHAGADALGLIDFDYLPGGDSDESSERAAAGTTDGTDGR